MIVNKLYLETALQQIVSGIQAKQEQCLIGNSTGLVVLKGTSTEVDEQYCIDHNIPILPVPNGGGCTVIHNDDPTLAYLTFDVTSNVVPEFLNEFCEWLKQKGLDASFDNNDVLIDGTYKVASGSSHVFNGEFAYFAVHISENVDLDLIRHICLKPMIKIPKGLSDYGITGEECERFLIDFFEKK